MLVENKTNNSEMLPPTFNSWLEYWEHYQNKGKKELYMHCTACRSYVARINIKGAVVNEVNATDGQYYVIPLCKGCYEKNIAFNAENYLLAKI